MKRILNLSILTGLLVVTSSPCFAMMEISFVSKERAKELGVEIRATASGPKAAMIALEFNPEKFKDFNCVYLEINEGEKFLMGYTPLKEKHTKSGTIVVGLTANREFLQKVTLTIVTGSSGLVDLAGHALRVKDFVDLKKLDDNPPKKTTGAETELPASSRPADAPSKKPGQNKP
jgi:hypothetical protein